MTGHDSLRGKILDLVWEAAEQRIRPHEIVQRIVEEQDIPLSTFEDTLKDLISEGELVYTYRDPCSYIEVPFGENHQPARPLKVIPDSVGELWICDADVDPAGDCEEQGCWRCGDLAFTASD